MGPGRIAQQLGKVAMALNFQHLERFVLDRVLLVLRERVEHALIDERRERQILRYGTLRRRDRRIPPPALYGHIALPVHHEGGRVALIVDELGLLGLLASPCFVTLLMAIKASAIIAAQLRLRALGAVVPLLEAVRAGNILTRAGRPSIVASWRGPSSISSRRSSIVSSWRRSSSVSSRAW